MQLMLSCADAVPAEQVAPRHAARPTRRSRHRAHRPVKATHAGFDLHAGVTVDENDTPALERLVRYLARPPLAADKVRLREDARVVVDLRRPKRNGVRQLVFEPVPFLARLAALVPAPFFNMTRHHGVFAPASLYRPLVVPIPPSPADTARPVAPKRPMLMPWAYLLKRAWSFDVLACPCGGRFRTVTTIFDPHVVQLILAAIAQRGTSERPARPPPATNHTRRPARLIK